MYGRVFCFVLLCFWKNLHTDIYRGQIHVPRDSLLRVPYYPHTSFNVLQSHAYMPLITLCSYFMFLFCAEPMQVAMVVMAMSDAENSFSKNPSQSSDSYNLCSSSSMMFTRCWRRFYTYMSHSKLITHWSLFSNDQL